MTDDLSNKTFGRRRLLGGAASLAVGVALTSPTIRASAARAVGRRLTLPAPTGPYAVGTVSRRLVDRGRQDAWWATAHDRELMITVWYPAEPGGPIVPWMEAGVLARYRTTMASGLEDMAKRLGLGDVGISLDKVHFPFTAARRGAPVRPSVRPCPVVLYSPGAGESRWLGTTLVQDLASRGYVVVAIDHTYDAMAVQFPDGRVETERAALDPDGAYSVMKVRIADTRFVLDQLARGRILPLDLTGSMDLTRIGMFGHSLGGATTAQGMANDVRIKAGIDLDGHVIPTVSIAPPTPLDNVAELVGEVATRIGDRPFMIMSSDGKGPDQLGVLMSGFWSKLRGERRFLSIKGTTHASYTDAKPLIHQLAAQGIIPAGLVQTVGTIGVERAQGAERAYVAAFFDRYLRGQDNHLLDGPSEEFPDVVFFPNA